MKYFIFMLTFCNIYVIIIKTKIVYENFNKLKSRGELDMRKKILAIALATTMAFSTAVVAVPANKNVAEAAVGDATVKDLDIGDAFTANTGDEDVSGNFQLVYKFTNKSVGTNNWDNYIVEIFDGAGQYIQLVQITLDGLQEHGLMMAQLWSGAMVLLIGIHTLKL